MGGGGRDYDRDRDRDKRGGGYRGGDRSKPPGLDGDEEARYKDGQKVNPNYKGDLADYKPNFRPGQKSKSVPNRR